MCAKKVQYGLGEKSPQKTPLRWLYLPFMLLLGLGSMVLATQRIAAQSRSKMVRLCFICVWQNMPEYLQPPQKAWELDLYLI